MIWRGVLGTTVVLGVVGALRARREARLVAAGLRPASHATADPTPTTDAGRIAERIAERIAAWQPARPVTSLGRGLAMAWAAPLSAIGLVVAMLGRAEVDWDDVHGVAVASRLTGPAAMVLEQVGADASTLGHVVLLRGDRPSPGLLAHEAAHARQAERLGPLLVPVYAVLSASHGYRDHPLERAARLAARRALAVTAGRARP